jgi:radical SAM protein with 4Fe4S-binding SPASM domain
MQPKTTVRFDNGSFQRLRERLNHLARSRRALSADPAYAAKVPGQIGIKLNNGCNLRCATCYEWNHEGYHQRMGKKERHNEIPLALIERTMQATRPAKAKIYLWGGEPLMYSEFDGFMQLLELDPRWTTICTNAILTERRLDSMLRASQCLAVLASVDGLNSDNDAIRGKGTFTKVVTALQLLLDLKRKGIYKGTVSVSLTLNDNVIGRLYDFVQYFEAMGVNSIYMVFPWYIPSYVADSMDRFVAENLPGLAAHIPDWSNTSWHSFTYHVSPEKVSELQDDIARIVARVWDVRVRFHPALKSQEVADFVLGKPVPAEGKTSCVAITNRVDLLPNGDVVSCKFFPELTMGNIAEQPFDHAWRSETFTQFRRTLACGLSPVCSKCTLLYSTG